MRLTIAGAALLLLAACGGGNESGLTDAENDALNNAAEMLEAAPDGADETGLGNELAPPPEEPAANQP